MTTDESRVFLRLLRFSLNQAELLSNVTTTVFQWMNNQESMQVLRDEMVKGLVLGDKSENVIIILSRLSELTQRACAKYPDKTQKLFDALKKLEAERNQ